MNRHVHRHRTASAWVLAAVLSLAGCGTEPEHTPPLEVLREAAVLLDQPIQGELRSAKATPLQVPGSQFANRQLTWMLAEGSAVQAGEVIARFSAPQSELELKDVQTQLLRNAIARSGKQAELAGGLARIEVDQGQVETDLQIAERYADAELDFIARNELLDAVQNREFLLVRKQFLDWKQAQGGTRGAAELAVLDSQRASQQQSAERRSADLAALELTAPHAGVLMLQADWSGEKPRVGASMWAGSEFGSLPDASAMEVQFVLSQLDAAGVETGAQVELYPLGRPTESFRTEVSWVAAAAQAISRQNPIKYVRLKTSVPTEAVTRLRLVPGQTLAGRVATVRAERGLSVPNVAILAQGERTEVEVWVEGKRERRAIRLGARGPARSQVLEGLQAGDAVILTPQREPTA